MSAQQPSGGGRRSFSPDGGTPIDVADLLASGSGDGQVTRRSRGVGDSHPALTPLNVGSSSLETPRSITSPGSSSTLQWPSACAATLQGMGFVPSAHPPRAVRSDVTCYGLGSTVPYSYARRGKAEQTGNSDSDRN